MDRRQGWSGLAAAGVAILTFGGVALGLSLEARAPSSSSVKPADVALLVAFLSLPAVGVLLIWRRPANAVGWLLGAAGSSGGLYVAAHGWAVYALRTEPGALPGGEVAASLVTWLLVPTFGVLPYLVAAFPSGRIQSERLRRAGRVAAWALVALALAQALAPDTLDGLDPSVTPIDNPLGVPALQGVTSIVTGISVFVVVAFTLAAIVNGVGRYRRATGDERRQLRAVAAFPALVPASIPLSMVVPAAVSDAVLFTAQAVGLVGLSMSIAVAVLRYRLYDLGDYVRRTAVYVLLSAAVVGAVLAVASLVAVLLPVESLAATALAAAAVALALGPLRARLQRGVDRLLFGQRDDPYAVLSEVRAGLDAPVSPGSALTSVAGTVAVSLRVPYVAIESDGSAGLPAVRYGEPRGATKEFPLVFQHQHVGKLVVGQRSADEAFSDRELQLLSDLARQVAVAVMAATATAALQQARVELVQSREEERRRLRRDLHDGLGPTLAGTMLQLDAVLDLMEGDAAAADARAVAARVKDNLRAMVEDVRRLSHDLRPPALDDLGLVGALQGQVQSLAARSGLDVEVDLPPATLSLGAAADVAVYRIVSEALTNVVRHARARHCLVRLSVDGGVDLEVVDDGIGMPTDATAGVGLLSMRERTAELGGSCTIEAIEPSGTRVHAWLPAAR